MRALRFTGRGLWIALLLLGHGLLWFVGWLALLVSFRGKAARQAWFGRRLAALLIGLGATFVKVGQIMSTRPDLFPPHIIGALTRLQDDVGAFAWRHVERAFREDFGKGPDELFARFDRAPVVEHDEPVRRVLEQRAPDALHEDARQALERDAHRRRDAAHGVAVGGGEGVGNAVFTDTQPVAAAVW